VNVSDTGDTPEERSYDVSADGRRLLLLKREALSTGGIRVVLNWAEELTRLVPTQ
jgi:hypothetical protein